MTNNEKINLMREIIRQYDEAIESTANEAVNSLDRLLGMKETIQEEKPVEQPKAEPTEEKVPEGYSFDIHEIYHRIYLRSDNADSLKLSNVANFVSQKCQNIGIKMLNRRYFNDADVEQVVEMWFNKGGMKNE